MRERKERERERETESEREREREGEIKREPEREKRNKRAERQIRSTRTTLSACANYAHTMRELCADQEREAGRATKAEREQRTQKESRSQGKMVRKKWLFHTERYAHEKNHMRRPRISFQSHAPPGGFFFHMRRQGRESSGNQLPLRTIYFS